MGIIYTTQKCQSCSVELHKNPQLLSKPARLAVCDYCAKRVCPSCRVGTVCNACRKSAHADDVA